jgi:hypothetical protein
LHTWVLIGRHDLQHTTWRVCTSAPRSIRTL